MSNVPNSSSTRQQVLAALSLIVGLPLTATRLAADMRVFHFGELRAVDRSSVGEVALHVQCPWRIEGPEGIITGRSDLWQPADDALPFDEHWDYEKSPHLQNFRLNPWFTENESCLIVTSVEADDFGGAAISFRQDFTLRLFPSGTRGEDWRLFRPRTDAPHFVICGGAVESDDEV